MRQISVFLFVLVFASGCALMSNTDKKGSDEAVQQSKGAYIFVDGIERATTPATLRVRRGGDGLGISKLSLRSLEGKKLRKFRVERKMNSTRTRSSDGNSLLYGFGGDQEGGSVTYDLQDLPMDDDSTYVIPYLGSGSMTVEDREYGLTLIVEG